METHGADPYFELLKEQLIHRIALINRAIHEFTKLSQTDFELISEIIDRELSKRATHSGTKAGSSEKKVGENTTISVSTLERMFRYGYKLHPMDKRTLHNLDVIAKFLDYDSWYSFVEAHNKIYHAGKEPIEHQILNVVRKASRAEYHAYKALPELYLDELQRYLVVGEQAYRRVKLVLDRHRKKGWVINNPGNSSASHVYDIRILKLTTRSAIVEEDVHVYLRWFDLNKGDYTDVIYDKFNTQKLHLVFANGVWKVAGNYYPTKDKAG